MNKYIIFRGSCIPVHNQQIQFKMTGFNYRERSLYLNDIPLVQHKHGSIIEELYEKCISSLVAFLPNSNLTILVLDGILSQGEKDE